MQRENFALRPETFLSTGQMSLRGSYLQEKHHLMLQSALPYLSAKAIGKLASHRAFAAAASWVQVRGEGRAGPSPSKLSFLPGSHAR